MTTLTGHVPDWPHIRAVIHDDGSGEIDFNGTVHTLAGNETLEDARRHMENHLAGIATWLSRPVRAYAESPDGTWVLVVHPDGAVEREVADEPPWSSGADDPDTPEVPDEAAEVPDEADEADEADDEIPTWVSDPAAALPQGLIFPPHPAPAEEEAEEVPSSGEAPPAEEVVPADVEEEGPDGEEVLPDDEAALADEEIPADEDLLDEPEEELPDEPEEDLPDEPEEDLPDEPEEDLPDEPEEDLPAEAEADLPAEAEADAAPESESSTDEDAPAEPEERPAVEEDVPTEGAAARAVASVDDLLRPKPGDVFRARSGDVLQRVRRLTADRIGVATLENVRRDPRRVAAVAAVAVLLFGGGTVGYQLATDDAESAATGPAPGASDAPASTEPTESASERPTVSPGTTVPAVPKPPLKLIDATSGKGWAAFRVDSRRPVTVRLTLTPLGPAGKPQLRNSITRRIDVGGGERTAMQVENIDPGTYRWRIRAGKGDAAQVLTGTVEVADATSPSAERPDAAPPADDPPATEEAPPPDDTATPDDPPPSTDEESTGPGNGGIDDGLA